MAPFLMRTAVLVACIAFMATPSSAQRADRQNGGNGGGRREGVQRMQPRGEGQPRGGRQAVDRQSPWQNGPRGRVESRGRIEPQSRIAPQQQVAPPERTETRRRTSSVPRVAPGPRPAYGYASRPNYVAPRYGYHPRVVQPYVVRPYVRPYVVRPYVVARPYVVRPRVLPYGYRPYGYRPGWSLNLYFGSPIPVHGYPVYRAPHGAYGYYPIVPGYAFGALRVVDAPRDAQVLVDGHYAGVVDDYDGVFQHLNLAAGSHHIEIESENYPPIAFDVLIQPGQTITYRAFAG